MKREVTVRFVKSADPKTIKVRGTVVEEATIKQEVSGLSRITRVFNFEFFCKINANFNAKYIRSTLNSKQNI